MNIVLDDFETEHDCKIRIRQTKKLLEINWEPNLVRLKKKSKKKVRKKKLKKKIIDTTDESNSNSVNLKDLDSSEK